MIIGSLFSGIGGLELGLEMSGLGTVAWQVEQSEFCRSVLARHWPDAKRFENVEEVGERNLNRVDVLCGGFPCQDISSAGKGAGLRGSRSGLWFEYARIIEEIDPTWVVVENVASGARKWVDQVSGHLAELGYEVLPVPVSAADVGAPHLRRRIFLVAYSYGAELRKQQRRGRRETRKSKALAELHGVKRDTTNTMCAGRARDVSRGRAEKHAAFEGDYAWHGGDTCRPCMWSG